MPKYNVTVKVRYFVYVEVDSDNEAAARDLAEGIATEAAPNEITAGIDSERSNIDVIGVEQTQ
jgi:hypothetical protein